MKKPSFQIKFPASFQDFGKTGLRLTPIQVSAKFPKLENRENIKSLQRLITQGLREVSKFPEKLQKKFQVFTSTNLIPAYLRKFFSSLEPAPPPYTMESVTTLQVVMEVTDFAISSNS